ncbi:hypothetical protein EV121DRAFT_271759 [Schizophyllum commune]
MVFGLFSRKAHTQPESQAQTQQVQETQSPDVSQQPLRTPSPTHPMVAETSTDSTTAAMDVDTPPASNTEEQLVALRALVNTMPAPSLKEYVVQYLEEDPLRMNVLDFFKDMAPPPLLHCLRCHSDYYDVENTPTSCRVAHDDDSTLVERVGGGRGYETLWQCCGKTTEGDGDQGPPDGWCYEGEHTTDIKRARFRADATNYDDKLVSCLKRKCGVVVIDPPSSSSEDGASNGRSVRSRGRKSRVFARTSPSPARSTRSRSRVGLSPMRPSPKRKLNESDEEQEEASDAEKPQQKRRKRQPAAKASPSTSLKPTSKSSASKPLTERKPKPTPTKPRSRAAKAQQGEGEDDNGAAIEVENNPPKRRGRPPGSKNKPKEPVVPPSDRALRARSATPARTTREVTPARTAREATPGREKTLRKAAKEAPPTPRTRAKRGTRAARVDEDEAGPDVETVVVHATRTKRLDEVVESSIPGEC